MTQWVLVTDTNIWIDLDNGEILAEVFRLPYQFQIPDLATQELIKPPWETLRRLGLLAQELGPELIAELAGMTSSHRSLSLVDLAACLLAKHQAATLLTGDRRLRELSTANGVSVHGIFWLFDELVDKRIVSTDQAILALEKVMENNPRLPQSEFQKRIENWKGSGGAEKQGSQ